MGLPPARDLCIITGVKTTLNSMEDIPMKHIKTIQQPCINASAHTGCGECQASCQSACKTSCTVANQKCQKESK